MSTVPPSRGQLIEAVNKLPPEALPELASFLSYLQFKAESSPQAGQAAPAVSGSEFLLSIAGLGEADAHLSEQDEEILAEEIDAIRGWSYKRGTQS